VTERRTEILDAALAVLAAHGMRGLTHRAVDAEAGIAAGSTSYYFRSRSALVGGCVERLLEIDMRVEVPTGEVAGRDPAGVAALLAGIAVARATNERHLSVARYELTLAGMRDPELAALIRSGGDVIRQLLAAPLGALGASDPAAAAEEVGAAWEGLLFTALVRGPQDPAALTAWLRPALERVLLAQPGVGLGDPSPAG
jgi:DNA-binding transcriptional regulator YbjK